MTLRRRIVDWSLTGILILLPGPRAAREPVARHAVRRSIRRCCGSPRRSRPACRGSSKASAGLWSRYVALVDVEAENRELRDENERLRKELAAMTRRAFDVAALEDLAVVKKRTPADTLGARVIGAPLSPQFRVLRLRDRSRRSRGRDRACR